MNYWEECIKEAFEDANIEATKEQIDNVIDWVEGAFENYSTAHGHDCISSPVESQAQHELRELKQKNEKKETWVNSTKPCCSCLSTGRILDGWGRDMQCMNCDGKGRI